MSDNTPDKPDNAKNRPAAPKKPRLEHLAISKLVPYARNSRTHSPEQIAQIAASIREFGFTNPVLIDANNGIVAGHGRAQAAQSLGLTSVPCLRLEGLTEAQIRAYVIADNKLALNAGWDDAVLAGELKALADLDFDLDLVGFSAQELDELLAMADATPEGETPADATPEPQAQAISKPGDIWILGRHRLACGDSTRPEPFAALMAGGTVDLVFTDPPYGVNYADVVDARRRAGLSKGHKEIANDALNDEQQKAFWLGAFRQIHAVLKPGGVYYVCSPQGGRMMMMMMMMMQEAGLPQRHEIIWRKNRFVLGRADYHYQHEPILYGWKEGAGHAFYGGRDKSSVWEVNAPQKADLHPTMKPVELIEIAIANSSRAGDVVLDAFGGSGSTLIACERTGRACRMVELDAHYCDVIVRRWQQYTGQRATHAATMEPFPS